MPTAIFDNVTLTVWSAGVQVQVDKNPGITFISKSAIGSLHVIKDTNGSYIRYMPTNFSGGGPYELAKWWSEKVSNDHAFAAYEYIMEWLYDKSTV
jgi:hypothetical protein